MSPLPFLTRLWFAWVCYFKILFDGSFAARVYGLPGGGAAPELPEKTPEPKEEPKKEAREAKKAEPPKPPPTDAALQLLALLQREGRLVDFLEEDVASFSDADIGAAARVVHQGCRKALRDHVKLEPVRSEDEGVKVTLEDGFKADEVKLTGNVAGKGPYNGTLRHRGWRAKDVSLPHAIDGHDARIIAQAEVEL